MTENWICSEPARWTSRRTSPCSSAVCSIALRARLRSACASRSGSAFSVPLGTGSKLESPLGGEADPIPELGDESAKLDRLGTQEVGLLGRGEEEQIVNEASDAAYLGLNETLDSAHLGIGGSFVGD